MRLDPSDLPTLPTWRSRYPMRSGSTVDGVSIMPTGDGEGAAGRLVEHLARDGCVGDEARGRSGAEHTWDAGAHLVVVVG